MTAEPPPSLDKVAEAANAIREREAELARLQEEFDTLLLEAHDAGLTWVALAEAGALERPEEARDRAFRSPAAQQPIVKGYRPQGVTVQEAASRLGVTRLTVYTRIMLGQLKAVADPSGRTRVLL